MGGAPPFYNGTFAFEVKKLGSSGWFGFFSPNGFFSDKNTYQNVINDIQNNIEIQFEITIERSCFAWKTR